MKAIHYLIFSLVLVLLTTGTYYLSKPTLTYTGALYLMTIDTPKSPPGLLYGWPVNGSLLQIDSRTSLRFLGARGNQFMEQRLWDNMPTLPFSISDPNNAMVLCSTGPSY